MSLETLVEQAQSVAARARRQIWIPAVASLAATIVGTLRVVEGTMMQQVVWGLIVTALWVWPARKAWDAYRIHRWVWPGSADLGHVIGQSIEFYRKGLERDRALALRRYRPEAIGIAGTIIVGVAMFRGTSPVDAVPLVLIVTGAVALAAYARQRELRRIARELDDLDTFSREG